MNSMTSHIDQSRGDTDILTIHAITRKSGISRVPVFILADLSDLPRVRNTPVFFDGGFRAYHRTI